MSSQNLENKIVLITGAASGIGKAAAKQFAEKGARVFCSDVNEEGLRQTVEEILEAGGIADGVDKDIRKPEQCKELVEIAVGKFSGLDVLCNIAGVGKLVPVVDEKPEDWYLAVDVNVNGPFFLSQAAIPHLLERKGNIVNIASTAGLAGHAYLTAYSTTKHAIIGMTKSMAVEFGRQGVRCNAIAPGGTKTPFFEGFDFSQDIDMDLINRLSLIHEMAEPEDVANAICFIASDEAKFINGSVLSIDGGTVAA